VHWVVLVRLSSGAVYLYDPLGPVNKRMTSDGTPSRLAYDHSYQYHSQLSTTGHCGYFAVYVARIIRRLVRLGRLAQTDLTNAIKTEFGRSADWGDAKRVVASGIAYTASSGGLCPLSGAKRRKDLCASPPRSGAHSLGRSWRGVGRISCQCSSCLGLSAPQLALTVLADHQILLDVAHDQVLGQGLDVLLLQRCQHALQLDFNCALAHT